MCQVFSVYTFSPLDLPVTKPSMAGSLIIKQNTSYIILLNWENQGTSRYNSFSGLVPKFKHDSQCILPQYEVAAVEKNVGDFSSKMHIDDGGLVPRTRCVCHLEIDRECIKIGFGPLGQLCYPNLRNKWLCVSSVLSVGELKISGRESKACMG